jgi:hypothetical protein
MRWDGFQNYARCAVPLFLFSGQVVSGADLLSENCARMCQVRAEAREGADSRRGRGGYALHEYTYDGALVLGERLLAGQRLI